MTRFPSVAFSALKRTLKEFLHSAVLAPQYHNLRPRWRSIGQPVLPYHYLRPLPVVNAKKS